MTPELLQIVRTADVADDASRLLRELQIAGVDPPPHVMSCAEALAVDAPRVTDTLANRILANAAASRAMTLTVRFDAAGDDPLLQFEMLCRRLRAICGEGLPAMRRIGLAVDARRLAPQAARGVQRACLPGSTLVVLLDSSSDAWLQAWQMRDDATVHLAMPACVQSPCALLSPEQADGVLPVSLLRVPVGSAWLPLRIDLSRFAAANGRIRYSLLDQALAVCVSAGDQLLDLAQWPSAAARHDAWFNRRLAVDIGGIAALLRLRGMDPCSMHALEELRELVGHVRETLSRYSLQLASLKSMAPCIEETDPGKRLPPGSARDDWRMRWRRAVKGMSFRNRNIVTMSPWSLVARCGKADFSHANLLPLIRDTDVVAFSRAASVSHWNMSEFREFHLRLAAVLQQKNTAPVFAERV